MGWGLFFFEVYIRKGKEDLAHLRVSGQSDQYNLTKHREHVAKYLQDLDKAIAENDIDDLEMWMNT